jgi:hypothetical protein
LNQFKTNAIKVLFGPLWQPFWCQVPIHHKPDRAAIEVEAGADRLPAQACLRELKGLELVEMSHLLPLSSLLFLADLTIADAGKFKFSTSSSKNAFPKDKQYSQEAGTARVL